MNVELQIVGAVLACALFWLMYFDLKDGLRPEPRRLLLGAFGLGIVAAFLALGGFRLADAAGWTLDRALEGGERGVLAYCLVVVGPIEEGAKFLVAWLVVFRWRHFDEAIDGLVYAAAIALGFASLENLIYLPQLEGWERWGRAIASPLTHAVWSAVWGIGCGHALVVSRTRRARWLWCLGTLAAAMLLHALYDAALVVVELPWLASLLVLVLWVAIIVHARRLVRARRATASSPM